MARRVFHSFRVKELLLRYNFPILHRIIAGGRGLTGMQITVGGGGREGYAKKLINATVVLLFKLSGAFLGKLMCLQGDCRPDGKREPTLPLPAPALGQITGSPAQLGTSGQNPPCTHTPCRTAVSPRIGCVGLLHAEERRWQEPSKGSLFSQRPSERGKGLPGMSVAAGTDCDP